MSYPKEHSSIVRASYSTLIERGINPSLAVLVSEVMGRDAAGMERTERDMNYIRQVVAQLDRQPVEEFNALMSLQTEVAA